MRYLRVLVILLITIVVGCILAVNPVYAHQENLGIEGADGITYDSCVPDYDGLGYDEKWYSLYKIDYSTTPILMEHIDDDIKIIYYKIHLDTFEKVWGSLKDDIQEMLKLGIDEWNSVSIYKENDEKMLEAIPLVKLVDVDDLEDSSNIETNIDIYYEDEHTTQIEAHVEPVKDSLVEEDTQVLDDGFHYHYRKFKIILNANAIVGRFTTLYQTMIHELGHVFGLADIDTVEPASENPPYYHHQELLMGYASNNPDKYYKYMDKTYDITYRDLVGAAITRGFHTNQDHKWLYDESNSKDGASKLICSICNCVKYVTNLNDYEYEIYKKCQDHLDEAHAHTLESGNMMPVARYNNLDYWKCKYCRATKYFDENVEQQYVYAGQYDANTHVLRNTVKGLEYNLVENHQFTIDLGNGIYQCQSCPICSDGNIHVSADQEYGLNCIMETIQDQVELINNNAKIIKLVVDCEHTYTINVSSNNAMKCILLDDKMKLLNINGTSTTDDTNQSYNIKLQAGTYYLLMQLNDKTLEDVATISFATEGGPLQRKVYLSEQYDIYEHIHNNHTEFSFKNTYDRIARIMLEAKSISGATIYPEGTIIVKDEDGTIINKFPFASYYQEAINREGQNVLIAYLPKYHTYTIEINYSHENIEKAYFSIDFVNTTSYNSFEDDVKMLSDNFEPIIDDIKSLGILQNGRYEFNVDFAGTGNDNLLFLVLEQVAEKDSVNYNILFMADIEAIDKNYNFMLDLFREKEYYIGFFGGKMEGSVCVTMQRYCENANAMFITDPDSKTACGTEVTLNGGLYRGSTITEGLNRIAYFESSEPSTSRLDYYWYSSDETILTVSDYGTIQALKVIGRQRAVIMAVYKYDMTKVYRRTFEIYPEVYASRKEIEYNIKITLDTTYQVKPDNRWPCAIIQNYTWESDNPEIASVNIWGIISGRQLGKTTIKGYYNYNKRYLVIINLEISN